MQFYFYGQQAHYSKPVLAEKSYPDNEKYIPSGIYRKDNSWLFVIGDEKIVYIFSTKYLKKLECRYEQRIKTTSKGFLIPITEAEKYCIRKIVI